MNPTTPPNIQHPRIHTLVLVTTTTLAALATLATSCRPPPPRTSTPLPHEAYVWQRHWPSNVSAAVQSRAHTFTRIVFLAGEVTFNRPSPTWTPAAPDLPTLRSIAQSPSNTSIGLALRVGPFPGPFAPSNPPATFIRNAARQALRSAQSAGIPIDEFQIDFDCADRHLHGYQSWITALKQDLHPTPVILTALPSWIHQPAFPSLVRAADGYVLQVHSLQRPASPAHPTPLCDPDAAIAAVEQAARTIPDVPFRVALPTYSYELAYHPNGRFLALAAEGPPLAHSPDSILVELHSDPTALAGLVARWSTNRPAPLNGIIWYRLPVPGDQRNWRWPTLLSVIQGQPPKPSLHAHAHPIPNSPGLADIQLTNSGTADIQGPVSIHTHWTRSQRVGADALHGFTADFPSPTNVLFTHPTCRLPAGSGIRIGWVRLENPAAIHTEILNPPP